MGIHHPYTLPRRSPPTAASHPHAYYISAAILGRTELNTRLLSWLLWEVHYVTEYEYDEDLLAVTVWWLRWFQGVFALYTQVVGIVETHSICWGAGGLEMDSVAGRGSANS